MECYKSQGSLHRRYAFQILLEILQYFSNQPTLVDVTVPDGESNIEFTFIIELKRVP